METIRALVEGFLRGRYGLAPLAVPMLIGAVLVVGWLLIGPSFAVMTIPRFSTTGPVVRNGVAAVMVCGKKSGTTERGFPKGLGAATKYAPEPGTGTWAPSEAREGECTLWYHRPPGLEQRFNRHERAQEERLEW